MPADNLLFHGTVSRRGKLLHVGVFPEKDAEITSEDLTRMVSEFTPVDIDLEHKRTLFDGKLGKLAEVSYDAAKSVLFGRVELPEWLDKVLSDVDKKVSLELDRATKKIVRLTLTANPAIPDAILFSNTNTTSTSKSENSTMTAEEIKSAISETVETVVTRLGLKKAEEGTAVTTSDAAKIEFSETAEFKAAKAQLDAQTAEIAALKEKNLDAQAEGFATLQFSLGKVTTAEEKAALTLRAKRAIKDDLRDTDDKITFSAENPSRFSELKSEWDAKAPKGLDKELTGDFKILFSDTEETDVEEKKARRKRMLESTPMGIAAMKSEMKSEGK